MEGSAERGGDDGFDRGVIRETLRESAALRFPKRSEDGVDSVCGRGGEIVVALAVADEVDDWGH